MFFCISHILQWAEIADNGEYEEVLYQPTRKCPLKEKDYVEGERKNYSVRSFYLITYWIIEEKLCYD
jgi:hypothetical protein